MSSELPSVGVLSACLLSLHLPSLYLHKTTFLMLTIKWLMAFIAVLLAGTGAFAQMQKAPAYPLIVHDPYFSIWSFSDTLNGSVTRHWTGTDQSLRAFVKVDQQVYSVMGSEPPHYVSVAPAADEEN